MGYSLAIALRYLRSRKRAFVSVGTTFAILGVMLGVAALATVMSVTGGFQEQFRQKVLGVNAHVLVLKYSIDFREYRDVMKRVSEVPGVTGVAPFVINPMMVTKGDRTATGVLLKGVDPELLPQVLDLPKHIVEGSLEGMRRNGAAPPSAPTSSYPKHIDTNETALPNGDAGIAPSHGILDDIRKEIKKDDERALAATEPQAPSASATAAPSANRFAPGNATPTGGFASTLPSDDFLPESIDPDPCRTPEATKVLPGVAIGRTLAKQLDTKIGDCLQITSPLIGFSLGASGGRAPIAKQFRVIAVFEAGFEQYDSKLVYTDIYEAQTFYEQGDSVTGVEMKVNDIDRAREISKEIEVRLANGIYHTMDWKELNHGLFTALLIQQIAMSIVLALIVVVAAFTVIATLVMVVLEKKKEIALLKALGASDDAILRIFLYQGAIIGLFGTGLGMLLGLAACKGLLAYGFPLDPKVYFISRLPVNVRPHEFIVTGVIALVICLIATVFPALYAARLRPSDGLRSE